MNTFRTIVDVKMREFMAEAGLNVSECFSFLEKLDSDNDWAFLIKVQTLIEKSVANSIVQEIGDERLRGHVERLPLIDDQIGKLALAKTLDLLDQDQRKLIRFLAELRNKLAHDIAHVDFTFTSHLASLDKAGIENWRKNLVWTGPMSPEVRSGWLEGTTINPRTTIWLRALALTTVLDARTKATEAMNSLRRIQIRQSDEVLGVGTQPAG